MRIIIGLLFTLVVLSTKSQETDLPVIADSLRHNAKAVVLFDRILIDWLRPDKMKVLRRKAVTVYRRDADYLAELSLSYNNENRIRKIKIEFYDQAGNLIRKVRRSDMTDMAAADRHTLYTDWRVLFYRLPALPHPFTAYIEYEIDQAYTAFIPDWNPVPDFDVSVRQSLYELRFPSDTHMDISEHNLKKFKVQKDSSAGKIIYRVEGIKAIRYEPLGPPLFKRTPRVKAAPEKFYLAGLYGEGGNPENLGAWMYRNLLAPQNNLPAETRARIRELVRDAPDIREKAKRIYYYMQEKTRYVNIAIGIGGWKPASAAEVDRLGYGDCKALTNYTMALMDAAGIESYFTLVYGGRQKRDIDTAVAGIQGNHAILCLPLREDTLWLECTDHRLSFGQKSIFTDDRNVWVIKPDGADAARTDAYKPEENLFDLKGSYVTDSSGNMQAQIKVRLYGIQYELTADRLEGLPPEEAKSQLLSLFHLNNTEIRNFRNQNNKEKGQYELDISFITRRYAVPAGENELLMPLNPFNRNLYVPPREKHRESPLLISRGYRDIDRYTVRIPDGYIPQDLPLKVEFVTDFGHYVLQVVQEEKNLLRYERDFTLYEGVYPPEQYEAYRKFRKKVKQYENLSVLLSR